MEFEDTDGIDGVFSSFQFHVQRAFSYRRQPPSLALQFLVHFEFSCNSQFSNWIILQDSTQPQLLSQVTPPLIETHILLNLPQFFSYKESFEILDKELRHWPVWGEQFQRLIDLALKEAREAVVAMPANHNVVHLQLHVAAVHGLLFDERRAVSLMMQQSLEEHEARMVPAKDSAIESLEGNKVSVDISGRICPVCMEELVVVGGCKTLLCMPCSHVFLGDCIKTWLGISHYCPVCRFEMPTD